jgi:hypothetical protein
MAYFGHWRRATRCERVKKSEVTRAVEGFDECVRRWSRFPEDDFKAASYSPVTANFAEVHALESDVATMAGDYARFQGL